jgi:phosphatidylinositol glycan class W
VSQGSNDCLQVAVFVWAVLQKRQSFFRPYGVQAYFVDFLLQCCTILCATTVYADSPQTLTGLLLLPAIAAYLQPVTESADNTDEALAKQDQNASEKAKDDEPKERDPLPVKPFITSYRGAMMIITCCSILAVDFPVFPRRFGKTEAFGTSLMDLGVGSFVFAAGVVAVRQQLKEDFAQVKKSIGTRMKTALRHSIPLAVLGFIRLATVKGLDYTEHESEYGVHWNFFFTLSLLSPTFALLQPVLRWLPSYSAIAFAIAVSYEILLYCTPLKHYIILSERIPGDFLSQNREGVYSFIGYFAIFMAGMGAGEGILPRDEEPPEDPILAARLAKDSMDEDADWLASVIGSETQKEEQVEKVIANEKEKPKDWRPEEAMQHFSALPKLAVIHLFKWSGIWFVCSVWCLWQYGPHLFVSRRMANCAYVCWVCAFNFAQLLLFCVVEMLMFPELYRSKSKAVEKTRIANATSKVLHAFNRNGLALFLLANLLTGAVNLTLETWHMSDTGAIGVLVAYISTIATVGVLLDNYDISIKL